MNGIDRERLPVEDAIGLCEMLITMKRAVSPHKWIDELREDDAGMGAI